MATATENEAYAKELKELQTVLARGPKPLAELPKTLQDVEFLAYCLNANKIQLGRPDYSTERKGGTSEAHEARPLITKASKLISWTALDQNWHKSIYELLQEDQEQKEPSLKLLVKLSRRAA